MLRLKGWHTEHVEIELSESDAIEAVIVLVQKKYKLKNVDGVDADGEMHEHVEYATSHSWISKEKRGKASEAQKKALEVIEILKKLKRGE